MTFGDLPRFVRERGAPRSADWAAMEQYDLVVPSSQKGGPNALTVRLDRYGPNGEHDSASVDVGMIEVMR